MDPPNHTAYRWNGCEMTFTSIGADWQRGSREEESRWVSVVRDMVGVRGLCRLVHADCLF